MYCVAYPPLPTRGRMFNCCTTVLPLLVQVLAYEANIEAAVLAQDAGVIPLPEDYTQFIPKVLGLASSWSDSDLLLSEISHTFCPGSRKLLPSALLTFVRPSRPSVPVDFLLT